MNIVEAYIKFNKGLIILISGLSGSGKTKLASDIEKDFKIKMINVEHHCVKENNKTIKLPNEVTVKDWDHIDSYNWEDINNKVNEFKEKGIVVCGPYFPTDKLKFEVDFHINIKISKQQLIQRRHNYIKKNPDICKELFEYLDTPTELLIINKITYPHFLEYNEKSKIDKYINAHELKPEQIYDQATDYLFNRIQIFLNEYNKNINRSVSKNSHSEALDSNNYTENTDTENTKSEDSDGEFLGTTFEDEDGEIYQIE
jgi:tRNA A37 threonylcarbamoyladenosine biosynthesis protein TsaE